jgi:hypothetical protein
MKAPAIEVRIDELVLEGFSPADRLRIGVAVERELSRLLRAPGTAERLIAGGDRPVVAGGTFAPPPGGTPVGLGASVARAVHAGLTR